MPLILASTCLSAPLQPLNKMRRLLGALCVLAFSVTLQAQVLSFAGLQSTLTAANNAPIAIAIDIHGNRFIINHGGANVTEVTAGGVQSTVAGSPGLSDPRAIAVDGSDNIYVADYAKAYIVKLPAGGGAAAPVGSSLSHPTGVAVDAAGDVYVADSGNARIYKVPSTGTAAAVAVPAGTFTTPTGIALDPYGNLYVSDTGNHSLIELTFTGSSSTVMAVPVLSSLTNSPAYVAIDSSSDVILSGGSDHAVTFYQVPAQPVAGRTIRQLGTSLTQPEGVAIDPTGNLYVADETNTTAIDIIAPGSLDLGEVNLCPGSATVPAPCTYSATLNFNIANGQSLSSVTASVGTEGAAGLDFTATNNTCTGALPGPTTCSVTVQFKPSAPGVRLGAVDISGIAGSATSSSLLASVPIEGLGVGSLPGFDAGLISSFPLTLGSSPYLGSVIADASGNLYFVDNNNCVIQKFVSSTGTTTTIAGTGTCGTASGDGGPATSAVFTEPWRLALSPRGDLYVSDDTAGVIRKVDGQTGIITTVAGTLNSPGHSDDETVATRAQLTRPFGLAFDAAGDLYFSDWAEHTVRKIDALSGVLTTVAGKYTLGCGTNGTDGDGGLATAASLNNPLAIALDSNDVLYIADAYSHLVRKVDPSTGDISTVAGVVADAPACDARAPGTYSGDNGPATSAHLNGPQGLAVDAAGNLYIADSGNFVVRKVSAATGNIAAVAGVYTGAAQNSGNNEAANLAGLGDVQDVATDGSGNFYVVDSTNSLISEVNQASGIVSFPGYTNLGSTSPAIDVALTNNGNTALDLSALTAPANFALSTAGDTTCTATATLNAGQSCVLGVEFVPTAVGALTGSFTITDDTGNSPGATQSLALSGTGAYVPTQVVLTGVPGTIATGGNLGTVQATIESSGNNVVANSTASVTATIIGPGSYSQSVTTDAVGGVASLDLSSLVLSNPGTYTVTAASAGLTSGVETATAVAPPHLVLNGLSASIPAGGNLGTATVSIENSSGAVITGSSASVTLVITGPANYSQAKAVVAVSGVATFDLSSLALTSTGTYSVTATSPGTTSANTIVTVVPPPATQLALSGIPASILTGGNLGTATVNIESASGSVVTTTSASVMLTITGPGSYSQALTVSARSGVATFNLTSLTLATAGTYTVTATSAGLTSATASTTVAAPITLTLTSAQASATIAAGGAATYTISLPATTLPNAQPVSFTATGLPTGATASFAPATVTPTTTAVSTTLTIQTTASTAALHQLRGDLQGLGGIAMGLLLLPFAASRRLRRAAGQMPMLSLLFGLLSAGAIFGLAGCGGGSSQPTTPTPHSYTITVTGTSGSASGSTTVTLIVQ